MPRFRPGLRRSRSWTSWSGSDGAERRVELDGHQLRHRQPQPARQLPADHLRDEHRQTLAGAGVLHDVGAEVVGLHQARQRPALAQRRDVPDGRDVAQQPHPLLDGTSTGRRARVGPVAHTGPPRTAAGAHSGTVTRTCDLAYGHRTAMRGGRMTDAQPNAAKARSTRSTHGAPSGPRRAARP